MASERARSLALGARIAGAILLASAASAAQSAPSASERETARSLMTDGRDRRARNDLRGALASFKAADAIMHVPTTGLEVARTEVACGQLVEARGAIRELFRIPTRPDEPKPFAEARAAALALDGELASRIPSIRLVLENATGDPHVRVDGIAIPAAAASAPIKLDPGRHVVEAGEGAGGARAEVTLAEREDRPVTLTLHPVAPEPAASAPPPAEPAPPRPRSRPARAIAIAGFGAGGAGLVAGSIAGFISIQKTSALKGTCDGNRCPPAAAGDLDTAHSTATVATLAFVAAGVGVAVGVGALLVGDPPADTVGRARVVPWIGPGMAGLHGTF